MTTVLTRYSDRSGQLFALALEAGDTIDVLAVGADETPDDIVQRVREAMAARGVEEVEHRRMHLDVDADEHPMPLGDRLRHALRELPRELLRHAPDDGPEAA